MLSVPVISCWANLSHSLFQELRNLLKSSNEGKCLLEAFEESGLLTSAGRRKLCNLIVSEELQGNPDRRISTARLHNLAFQITSIFKREHSSTYFIPYLSYGPGLKRSAKGKLLFCFNNTRRHFKNLGLLKSQSPCSSLHSSPRSFPLFSPQVTQFRSDKSSEDCVEENLLWLRNSYEPWDLVQTNWKITVHARLQRLMSSYGPTISDYFREFPALRQPSGYLLVSNNNML